MAKQIPAGSFPCLPHHGWHDENRAPYDYLLNLLCGEKSESECAQIQKEVEESYTYLLICEFGATVTTRVRELYEIEQKDGIIGVMYFLLHKEPHFRNAYENYEMDKAEEAQEEEPDDDSQAESNSLKEQKIKEWRALLAQPLPTHTEGLGEDLKNLDFQFKKNAKN